MSKHYHLTVWQNPPDFRFPLVATLLVTAGFSALLLLIGAIVLFEPDLLLMSYLEDLQGSISPDDCGTLNNSVSLCPMTSELTSKHLLPESWLHLVFGLMFVTGKLDLLICLAATVASYRRAKSKLFITLLFIPLSIVLEWKLVDLTLFVHTPIHEWAKDDLVHLYKTKYSLLTNMTNKFTRTLNTIMMTAGCCGIRNAHDTRFSSPIIIEKNDEMLLKIEYPPACCIKPSAPNYHNTNSTEISSHHVFSVVNGQCLSLRGTWDMSTEGCFDTVFRQIYERVGKHVFTLLMLLITLQSAQFILSVFVLLKRTHRVKIKRKSKESFKFISKTTVVSSKATMQQTEIDTAGKISTSIY